MNSTRKLPVAINEKKRIASGNHLIPELTNSPKNFVSVKTGKPYSHGAIVYLGKDVTPEMMLEQYCKVASSSLDQEIALNRLAAYCAVLQSVKIGNIVTIEFDSDGLPVLKVEQEYFLSQASVKLP
jgi:hypothetical protein